jgi:hypothetical protein
MPKRKRKILVGSGHPVKAPRFDWQLIEKAYGFSLSRPVRQKLRGVSIEYASNASLELTLAPVADACREIKRVLVAAEQLGDAIPELSGTCDGAWYARHLLMNHIRDPALPDPSVRPYRDPVQVLSQILASCLTACHSSLKELDNPDWSVEEGQAWKRWINRLTIILSGANLPISARKDEAVPSAFVSLVHELQSCLPLVCRRHTQSNQALALAIGRARVTKA